MQSIPQPAVMPLDRERWKSEVNLANFLNAFYEFRDLQNLGGVSRVLVVGPGQGLDVHILKWRGYDVTTFDIDPTLNPDYVGSVHEMGCFSAAQFDAVVVSHVLEHLAESYLDASLQEIARVGRCALVYLPVHGRHLQLRMRTAFGRLDTGVVVDLFNYFERPDGITLKYEQRNHFWEVGVRGFRVNDLVKRFSRYFEVVSHYRNRDWLPSYNFVLRSKQRATL